MSTRSIRYDTLDLHVPKGRFISGTDRDAGAFLEAALIYDTRQQRAIFELVENFKRYGLWSKMKAIYPFVGGTATTHKWNLKDPRDVDAAYRLTFNGGWTHSTTGADPNGTNAYADTYLPHNTMLQDSIYIGGYFRDNISSEPAPSIGIDLSPGSVTTIYPNYLSQIYATAQGTGGSYITRSITDARAWVATYRTSSTIQTLRRNNENVVENIHASATPQNLNFIIGAGSFSNVKYYNSCAMSMVVIGDGLTGTETLSMYNIVDLYQRRLGRAV